MVGGLFGFNTSYTVSQVKIMKSSFFIDQLYIPIEVLTDNRHCAIPVKSIKVQLLETW